MKYLILIACLSLSSCQSAPQEYEGNYLAEQMILYMERHIEYLESQGYEAKPYKTGTWND